MGAVIELEVPQDILESARITPAEALVELAVVLYAEGKLSFGKARELARVPHGRFRQILASRGIAAHYDVADVAEDRSALSQLNMT
jgi:predicted HTH domain antitoxin